MKRRSLILRLVLVVALVAAIAWLALHHQYVQAAQLDQHLRRFGAWAPIFFIFLYSVATVLFFPGSVLTIVGGALFGPLWGTLWNLAGATMGATLAFATARYVASDWVAMRTGERLARLMRGVEKEGWRFVAFVRLVPLFPFNLVNYAFGLTRIRLGEYGSSLSCAWRRVRSRTPIWARPNTVHLRRRIALAISSGGGGMTPRRRTGKLPILRLTARGLRRLRLETTRSCRISSMARS